jgi:O-antigen/teichoic acid export membrane protein
MTVNQYRTLRLSALAGVLWTGGGQVLRSVVSLMTSVLLARLLTPDDFGVFALSVLAVEFAQVFATSGFGASIVQSQDADPLKLSTLFWTNIALALACSLVLAAAAWPLADWFRQPQLAPVMMLASGSVLLSGAMVVPAALLNMQMRFRDITLAQTVGSLSGAAGAVGLAWAGAGVWALAAQPLIGSLVTLLEICRRSRWLPMARFSWVSVRELMRFSGQMLAANFLGFLNRSAWAGIIGRGLGTQQVGLFNLGQQVVFAPISQFSAVVVRVLFPTLAKLNAEPAQFRHVWLRAVGIVGFLTLPILAGLQASLTDFVPAILGKQWLEVIPVLKVLCFVAMLQSIGTLAGSVLLGGGHGGAMVTVSAASLVIMICALLIGQQYGLQGVTIGFAIGAVSTQLIQLTLALRCANIDYARFLRQLMPCVLSTAIMYAVMEGVYWSLTGYSSLSRLVLGCLAGTLSYLIASWCFNRDPIDFVLRSLRQHHSPNSTLSGQERP